MALELHRIDPVRYLELLCKTHKKWGMYVSHLSVGGHHPKTAEEYEELEEERDKAIPWLVDVWESGGAEQQSTIRGFYLDDCGFVLADTKEEIYDLYGRTVGDDGPTRHNNYNGSWRVYAITCDPDGNTHNENT